MLRVILGLLLTFSVTTPVVAAQSGTPGSDAEVCGDVARYFEDLDRLMFDGMREYFEDEDWIQDMDRMSRKASANDAGLFTLSTEDMQPLIDLMSVPGDILLDYPEDDIPDLVLPFHESAMSYWFILPAMMKLIGTGGVFAAMVFVEDMETAEAENAAALQELTAECPSLVEDLTGNTLFDDLGDGPEAFGEFDFGDIEDEDLHGFSFSWMTVPSSESDEDE